MKWSEVGPPLGSGFRRLQVRGVSAVAFGPVVSQNNMVGAIGRAKRRRQERVCQGTPLKAVLPGICFLELVPTSLRFHHHPKERHQLGTELLAHEPAWVFPVQSTTHVPTAGLFFI